MIAIGLDPSITGFGWSVLQGRRLVRCGVWSTKPDATNRSRTDDNAIRFEFLAQSLCELVTSSEDLKSDFAPLVIFVEAIQMMRDRFTTISGQGRCRGLVDGVAAARGLRVVDVQPARLKRLANAEGGRRKVDKLEVQAAVVRLYPDAADMIPGGRIGLNVSDAIAVAHVGIEQVAAAERLYSASYTPGAW